MPRRHGYSIHVIHPNGAPAPVGWRRSKAKAIDFGNETATGTGLEVRVWDTRTAKCVKAIHLSI